MHAALMYYLPVAWIEALPANDARIAIGHVDGRNEAESEIAIVLIDETKTSIIGADAGIDLS